MVDTGIIKKAHGVKGEVLYLDDAATSPETGELFYIKQPGGDFRPLRVEKVRSSGSSNSSFFVLFFGIETRTQAEELSGLNLYTDRPERLSALHAIEEAETEPDIFDAVGYRITDPESGLEGQINEVSENPAHPLLHAEINGSQILIPFAESWITDVNHDTKQVTAVNLTFLLELAGNDGE